MKNLLKVALSATFFCGVLVITTQLNAMQPNTARLVEKHVKFIDAASTSATQPVEEDLIQASAAVTTHKEFKGRRNLCNQICSKFSNPFKNWSRKKKVAVLTLGLIPAFAFAMAKFGPYSMEDAQAFKENLLKMVNDQATNLQKLFNHLLHGINKPEEVQSIVATVQNATNVTAASDAAQNTTMGN